MFTSKTKRRGTLTRKNKQNLTAMKHSKYFLAK